MQIKEKLVEAIKTAKLGNVSLRIVFPTNKFII